MNFAKLENVIIKEEKVGKSLISFIMLVLYNDVKKNFGLSLFSNWLSFWKLFVNGKVNVYQV